MDSDIENAERFSDLIVDDQEYIAEQLVNSKDYEQYDCFKAIEDFSNELKYDFINTFNHTHNIDVDITIVPKYNASYNSLIPRYDIDLIFEVNFAEYGINNYQNSNDNSVYDYSAYVSFGFDSHNRVQLWSGGWNGRQKDGKPFNYTEQQRDEFYMLADKREEIENKIIDFIENKYLKSIDKLFYESFNPYNIDNVCGWIDTFEKQFGIEWIKYAY